jgi:hypothetical protein
MDNLDRIGGELAQIHMIQEALQLAGPESILNPNQIDTASKKVEEKFKAKYGINFNNDISRSSYASETFGIFLVVAVSTSLVFGHYLKKC